MRILLVKTSSLGDVIHNLPVLTDIKRHLPLARVDWCVEAPFADIPRLHPGLSRVLPIALRRWRTQLTQVATWQEIGTARKTLSAQPYDLIIDTQGLIKSGLICAQATGPKAGFAADAAREPLAARFYDRHFSIPKHLHAVTRNRLLAAAALNYDIEDLPDYGLLRSGDHGVSTVDHAPSAPGTAMPYVVLLTASSREDKLWPDAHWIALGQALRAQGFLVRLPSGNPEERARAQRIAHAIPGAQALPPASLTELSEALRHATATFGVDTGLTHLAAALEIPCIALYTATDPGLTGVFGRGPLRNLGGKQQIPTVDAALEAFSALTRD